MTNDELQSLAIKIFFANNPNLIPPYNYKAIKAGVSEKTLYLYSDQNTNRGKDAQVKVPGNLTDLQIALLIMQLEPVIRISCCDSNSEFDVLGVYQSSGPDTGTYDISDRTLHNIIYKYNQGAKQSNLDNIKLMLKHWLQAKARCTDPDLIAVNNGIFDYKRKVLMPFDPDKVFLSKSKVNYNHAAQNIVIHNSDDGTDWDMDSWMQSLSDDPEIVNLLWEVLGAIIRPFVHWNKFAILYSQCGNSGKGTLCELMRNLCGHDNYTSIPLSDFGKEFVLEPLIHTSAIIVDENDVGSFLDKAANFKAVVTNDVIFINRKFRQPVSFQFRGFMVQCCNELPRIKDKTGSLYRRQLIIPFDKNFSGSERKYIKSDYLNRPEVLEYVLFKVLNMNYYQLSEPAACKEALDDYREYNDPVRDFANEILNLCVWDVLPFTFLYDLYKVWFAKNCPSGRLQGRNTFNNDIINAVADNPDWYCPGKKHPIHTGSRMDKAELLILQYNLKDWMNPTYHGADAIQMCLAPRPATCRGLLRRMNTTNIGPQSDSSPNT